MRPDFDDLLRKKLEGEALDYNPLQWQQLKELLPTASDMHFDRELQKKLNSEVMSFDAADRAKMLLLLDRVEEEVFDERVRDKVASEDFPYRRAAWLQLVAQLPVIQSVAAAGRRQWWIRISGVAAALLLIWSVVLFTVNRNEQHPHPTAKQHLPPQHVPALKSVEPHRAPSMPSHPVASVPFPQQASQNGQEHPGRIFFPDTREPDSLPALVFQTKELVVFPHRENAPAMSAYERRQLIAKYETPIEVSEPAHSMSFHEEGFPDPAYTVRPTKQNALEGNTSVGIGGGINYGNFKTGINFGLSARQYLGDKVFLDGVVAMNVTQGNDKVAAYKGDVFADMAKARPLTSNGGSSFKSTPGFVPSGQFYYLQVNPTLGYKFNRRVAISAGPDFQQLMTNNTNQNVMFFDNGEMKVIPDFDMGVTGKVDINISPSIQTGIIYREGINSAFRTGNYVDRRYMQVQLKYTLPVGD